MDPITLAIVIVVAGALINVIVYFLSSNNARARATQYQEKVQRLVEMLKKKLDDLTSRVNSAEREAPAARAEAAVQREHADRQAANAAVHSEAAAKAAAQAATAEERADALAAQLAELRRKVVEYEAELSRWRAEAERADALSTAASQGFSIAATRTVVRLVRASPVLGAHLMAPERALDALDKEYKKIETRISADIAEADNVLSLPTPKK